MRLKFLLLGLPVLAPLSALAADLPTKKAPPLFVQAAPDWSGFYAGSFIGGAVGVFTTRPAAGGPSVSGSGTGFTAGALAGYNWQTGSVVYGIEGDIGTNSAERKVSAPAGVIPSEVENIYSLHGRARLGYDFGMFMPFIAGGVVYGRNEQFSRLETNDGETKSEVGWTIGVGVDAKVNLPLLGPSVVRGEYLYDSYPATNFNLDGPVMHTSIADHMFRAALISRIDEAWRPPAGPDKVDWAGDYFGVIGGGAWDNLSTSGALGPATKFGASGPIGGVYSGHNWTFGQTVLGFEGATMLGNISGHGPQPGDAATSYHDYFQTDLRGRAGYAFGRLLPYFAAGVGYGQSKQVDLATNDQQGLVPAWSWSVGGGLEYLIAERWSVRAEYLYSRSFSSDQTHLDSPTCCAQTRTDEEFRVGLAYFFH